MELDPITIAVDKFGIDFSASMATWFEARRQSCVKLDLEHHLNQFQNQADDDPIVLS